MLHIELPDCLLQQIEAAGVTGSAVDEFVQQAVREKLADVGKSHNPQVDEAVNDFDTLCDEAAISAPGTPLTRDQLHERD